MRNLKVAALLSVVSYSLLCGINGRAEEVSLAVATNFTVPAKLLAKTFEANSAHSVRLSFASTGKLYVQLANGAPYDLLLAADQRRPAMAVEEGWAIEGSRFTYAIGQLALYSADSRFKSEGERALYSPDEFRKLAIANPKTAPYGQAALEVMKALSVYESLKAKIVQGENVGQAYQFVYTRNAELGFIALSQLMGSDVSPLWVAPEALHTPIQQDAVLLKRGVNNTAARAFYDFLQSPSAQSIIKRYGYRVKKDQPTLSQ